MSDVGRGGLYKTESLHKPFPPSDEGGVKRRIRRLTEGEKNFTQGTNLLSHVNSNCFLSHLPPLAEACAKRVTEGEKINTDFVSPPVLAAARRQASPLVRGGKEKDRKPTQTLSSL